MSTMTKSKKKDITYDSVNYTVLHQKILITVEKWVIISGWISDIIYHILTNTVNNKTFW